MTKYEVIQSRIKEDNRITLQEKWTVSKGANTYGYNICSLWISSNGYEYKVATCNGGGYDMSGTVLATFIQTYFEDRLHLASGYGVSHYEGKTFLDGACGTIQNIALKMGIKITTRYEGRNNQRKYITLEW